MEELNDKTIEAGLEYAMSSADAYLVAEREKAAQRGQNYPTMEELKESQDRYDAKHGKNLPDNEAYKKYLKDKFQGKKDEVLRLPTYEQLLAKGLGIVHESIPVTPPPYPIDLIAAKSLFLQFYKAVAQKDLVVSDVNKIGDTDPRDVIFLDGNMDKRLDQLIRYFIGDPTIEEEYCVEPSEKSQGLKFDLRKGLYIYGDVGLGKSIMFRAFMVFTQALDYSFFRIQDVPELQSIIEETKELKCLATFRKGSWLFDDLFRDSGNTNVFGNKKDLSFELIERFYRSNWRAGERCFVISNVKPADVKKQVQEGQQAAFQRRILEMFNPIEMIGQNKEKWIMTQQVYMNH